MRGVTDVTHIGGKLVIISTHTPHARRDDFFNPFVTVVSKFQLTRLMRGVTAKRENLLAVIIISTHTPHARRD